jgi:hypothetical protein
VKDDIRQLTIGRKIKVVRRRPAEVRINWALLKSDPSISNVLEGAVEVAKRSKPTPMTTEVDSNSVGKL